MVLLLSLLLYSCDMPHCNNTNHIFNKYSPYDNEYKAELARQISTIGRDNIKYWIDKYSVRDRVEYMSVFIQADGLCAVGIFDITSDSKMEYFKKVKGLGYSGAGLKGLKYRIDSANGNYNFVYEDVSLLID